LSAAAAQVRFSAKSSVEVFPKSVRKTRVLEINIDDLSGQSVVVALQSVVVALMTPDKYIKK